MMEGLGGNKMTYQWEDVTETFTESQRYYKQTYLEIDEVLDERLEVSLFSSETGPYEIYCSYGKMYGIIYTDAANQEELRKKIKADLEKEYAKSGRNPSSEFMQYFIETYNLCLPNDIFFDADALMK